MGVVYCQCGKVYTEISLFPVRCSCGGRYESSNVSEHETPTDNTHGKPGAELEKLIPRMFKSKTCSCRQYARKMDGWGVAGCTERFDEIVAHLVKQAKKNRIARYFGPVNRIVAAKWLMQAIESARAQAGPVVQTTALADDPRWFVAVTTAPRKDPTLLACIDSLRKAGWEPVVFAEPGSVETNCQTITHPQTLGVWHNWLAAARAGLDSGAPMILTVQDDVVLHPETKQLAEELLPETGGVLSLYTSAKYSRGRDVGVNRINTGSFWGACAFAWTAEALREALATKVAREWLGCRVRTKSANTRIMERRRKDSSLIANSDVAIGRAVKQTKRPIYTVDPSPAMHIARHSTQNRGDNSQNRNCGRCADHLLPLVPQVFPAAKFGLE